MYVIVRSRLWLFPGLLGPYKTVKRSTIEREAKHALLPHRRPSMADSDAGLLFFDLVHYLKRCQFPEFRSLFRALEKRKRRAEERKKDNEDRAAVRCCLALASCVGVAVIPSFLLVYTHQSHHSCTCLVSHSFPLSSHYY